jgi:hypothetical protein
MHHWTRRLFAIAAPLLLTGCLWGPGKFNSDLMLKKDGSFVLDYRGEIVLQLPDNNENADPWSNPKAKCIDNDKPRTCTATEIADQRTAYEKKREDAIQAAKMFGLPGLDDASNRAFAAKLMKYAGWRSVIYRGRGVFDVDYHFAGSAAQDFLFPALPDNDLLIPFVAIRRRADGSVLVTAPAFTGGQGPLAARAGQAAAGDMKPDIVSHAQGRFTIITDGEILTNNSEDGPAAHPIGHELHWDVDSGSKKIPEALIRL